MSAEYQKYKDNPKKDDRRKLASPNLQSKRFLLSGNPELKKRIKDLKKATEEMKQEHPEIVSFAVFGSLVKGYATETSDLDLYVFIDNKQWKKQPNYPATYFEASILRTKYPYMLAGELRAKLNLPEDQLKRIDLAVLDEEKIRDEAHGGMHSTDWKLFFLNTSRDIQKYRKIVLDVLQEMDDETPGWGTREWRNIMQRLFEFENAGLPADLFEKRKKLYSLTLVEARREFLSDYRTAEETI